MLDEMDDRESCNKEGNKKPFVILPTFRAFVCPSSGLFIKNKYKKYLVEIYIITIQSILQRNRMSYLHITLLKVCSKQWQLPVKEKTI